MEVLLSYDETRLLARLASGDPAAFASIYNQHQPRLHLFILPLTGFSKPDTEEIIQDVFFKLWLRRETLVAIHSLHAYLFTMAKNRLSDLRNQKTRTAVPNHDHFVHSEVEDSIQLNEYQAIARAAIEKLSPQKRNIFLLRKEQGLSLDEIAAKLGVTKFAVKKQLYDATSSIKDYLKAHAGIDIPLLVLTCLYFQ